MSDQPTLPAGPDLAAGVPAASLPDGAMLGGRVGTEAVLIARIGDELLAVSATCSHYGGPLAEGLLVGDTVRCPWHHACFSLRTGNVVRAPALRPIPRWVVERRGDLIVVARKTDPSDAELGGPSESPARVRSTANHPGAVVIAGAGAAGNAAAETLRREGYEGPITMLDGDEDAPYDRPNLSKDYLAGSAPEEWIPLRSPDFHREHGIDLRRGSRVVRVDPKARRVTLSDDTSLDYGALLIATGAEPVRLPSAVSTGPRVYYLRSLRDSRAIIAAASDARRAVVLGASFIGMEVAASLRTRGLEVHVVAPDRRPLERVLGAELGDFIRGLHEARGVVFHLERTASTIDDRFVMLDNGERIAADLVVAGIGVRPRIDIAAEAGLAKSRGVEVNEYLQTDAPGIYAAGDIAWWPDRHSGERIHVEHWVVAQRHGQTAARNMLGAAERFDAAPFFWSAHYDVTISYVGHAERWDHIEMSGNLDTRDCTATFVRGGKALAVATIGRDRASLEAELTMERDIT